MAIHDKFEVRVFVKGNPVHEYDASESCTDSLENGQTAHRTTGPVIGKCIEAVPGENFAIKLKTDRGIELKPRQALNFVVEVDGKFADGTIALKKNYDGGCGWMDTLTGVSHCVRGRWQLRKFRFQSLQTDTGPSTEKLDADEVAKIGSIQIIVRRVRVIKQEAPEPEEDDEGISSIKISERQLKGRVVDSQTGFDTPEKVSDGFVRVDTKNVDDVPLVTFIFRHYTRNGLKNLGVINEPDPPDPFDLLDPEKLSLEESLQLLDIAQKSRKKIKEENQQYSSMPIANKRARVEFESDGLEEIAAPARAARQRDVESVDLE